MAPFRLGSNRMLPRIVICTDYTAAFWTLLCNIHLHYLAQLLFLHSCAIDMKREGSKIWRDFEMTFPLSIEHYIPRIGVSFLLFLSSESCSNVISVISRSNTKTVWETTFKQQQDQIKTLAFLLFADLTDYLTCTDWSPWIVPLCAVAFLLAKLVSIFFTILHCTHCSCFRSTFHFYHTLKEMK